MNKAFIEKRNEVKQKLESFDQNAHNYQNVMKEFKEKLEKVKRS
ncbi:unnamed protein product [marine sediment metagenome]|uniref:Uncharacterized protein n=1 Tax=marine sediment metagenome TaxID=412755 RepID=X1AJP5_9ZZZZ